MESRAGRLPLTPGLVASSGAKVVYGVRPTALVLSDDAEAIKARIETVEPTGESTQIHVLAGAERLVVVFPGRPHFSAGLKSLCFRLHRWFTCLTPNPESASRARDHDTPAESTASGQPDMTRNCETPNQRRPPRRELLAIGSCLDGQGVISNSRLAGASL